MFDLIVGLILGRPGWLVISVRLPGAVSSESARRIARRPPLCGGMFPGMGGLRGFPRTR